MDLLFEEKRHNGLIVPMRFVVTELAKNSIVSIQKQQISGWSFQRSAISVQPTLCF